MRDDWPPGPLDGGVRPDAPDPARRYRTSLVLARLRLLEAARLLAHHDEAAADEMLETAIALSEALRNAPTRDSRPRTSAGVTGSLEVLDGVASAEWVTERDELWVNLSDTASPEALDTIDSVRPAGADGSRLVANGRRAVVVYEYDSSGTTSDPDWEGSP